MDVQREQKLVVVFSGGYLSYKAHSKYFLNEGRRALSRHKQRKKRKHLEMVSPNLSPPKMRKGRSQGLENLLTGS